MRLSSLSGPGLGFAAALAVLVGSLLTGAVDGSNATLQAIGFDPDRAQLITALLVAASAGAASALLCGRLGASAAWGLMSFVALFGSIFVGETVSALRSNGVDGSFDPGGWLLTLTALLFSGLVSGWAGSSMAMQARPTVVEAVSTAELLLNRGHPGPGRISQALAVVVVLLLLAVTLPVFGDLVNYSPDARMLHGGPPQVGLVPLGASPLPYPSAAATPSLAGSGSPPTVENLHPWLALVPTGHGKVSVTSLPAPFRGGQASPVEIAVYTPPGYDAQGSRLYPTLYEAPTYFQFWDSATNVVVALDTLIDSGALPASIMVFVQSQGGPYPDTECVNSYDGLQWWDTWMAKTVVPWVDSHYRTIRLNTARAVTGLSQGGFCAAILTLHHPDLFATAIPFSGYFHAGAAGYASARPFGGDPTAIAANSPDVVVGHLAPLTLASLYFILVAEPGQYFYGTQATRFQRILSAAGCPNLLVAAVLPHGWSQVRHEFATATEAWATRMVAAGVFSGSS